MNGMESVREVESCTTLTSRAEPMARDGFWDEYDASEGGEESWCDELISCRVESFCRSS
jgi:hypothetical protein